MVSVQSTEIEVEVEGKRLAGYFVKPAKPGPGIIVLHTWWGLNPFFKELCNRLGEEGYMVYAPDMNDGKIAHTVEEAEKIMEERDWKLTKAAAYHTIPFIRQQLAAQGDAVFARQGLGLFGSSFGGSWAIDLAGAMPQEIKAVVLFYGTGGTDFSKVQAHFQGHFPVVDEWTPEEEFSGMETAMRSAGIKVDFYRYPQAGHWFFESDRPAAYRAEDAALAWERTLAFFKSELFGAAE